MNAIDNILIREVESNKTPSVQYVIFNKDIVIHRFQYGLADLKQNLKTDENTTYNAFSVTKTFTALSILQLAEQKKLDIEQPVVSYLPGFPYSPDITIRQLLSHAAGIPGPIPLSWIHLKEEHQSFDRNKFFKEIFIRHKKTTSKPNEKFAYSNLGYVLLGQLIEEISGIKYEDYIHEHIIKPLHIKSNELDFIIADKQQHAKGYHNKFSFSYFILGLLINKSKYMGEASDKWKVFNDNYVNGASYGGLIGTSNALVKYIQELLHSDCRLISDEYKKLMFTENHTNNNKATGMCLSWFSGQLNSKQYFTHAGGGGGFYCEIRIYPQPGIGSVIMFNRTGMTDERYLDKVDKFIVTEK